MPLAAARAVPLVRRYSGGGCVYHDLGNSLYTLIGPAPSFARGSALATLLAALRPIRPALYGTERHDIFTREGGPAKVSGSAFRIARGRAYAHGTMLLGCDLGALEGLLASPLRASLSRDGAPASLAITSVPSPVANVGGADLDHNVFAALLAAQFAKECAAGAPSVVHVAEEDLVAIEGVRERAALLTSPAWILGRTPPFTLRAHDATTTVSIEGGLVVACEPAAGGARLQVGQPFDCQAWLRQTAS